VLAILLAAIRRVHIVIRHELPSEAPFEGPRSADEIVFSGIVRARIQVYSDDVMDAIRNQFGTRRGSPSYRSRRSSSMRRRR
jgi:hypothetical protein